MKTTKYDIFKKQKGNRPVDEKRIRELLDSIRKYGQLIPIAVNSKFEVVDGQGRLEVCKRLGIPVEYEISEKLDNEDACKEINTTQTRWKTIDHIWREKEYGNKDYEKLYALCQEFPEIKTAQVFYVASDASASSKQVVNGTFKFKMPLETAREFLLKMKKYKEFNFFKPLMINALFFISRIEGNAIVDKIYERLKKNPQKFQPYSKLSECIRSIETVYNYGSRDKRIWSVDFAKRHEGNNILKKWGY